MKQTETVHFDDPSLVEVLQVRTSDGAEEWVMQQVRYFRAGRNHYCGWGSKYLESGVLRRLSDEALDRVVRVVGEAVWEGRPAMVGGIGGLEPLAAALKGEAHARNREGERQREIDVMKAEVERQRESAPDWLRERDRHEEEYLNRVRAERAAELEREQAEREVIEERVAEKLAARRGHETAPAKSAPAKGRRNAS